MRILVDADACPVVKIIEELAKEHTIPLILVCDTAHIFEPPYGEVVLVDQGADAADYKLIMLSAKGDIVVTQDYGVASMALGKGAYPIHQSGKWYTAENIDQMMFERHLAKEVRRKSKKNHLKGPRKRTSEDDERFRESLKQLIYKTKSLL